MQSQHSGISQRVAFPLRCEPPMNPVTCKPSRSATKHVFVSAHIWRSRRGVACSACVPQKRTDNPTNGLIRSAAGVTPTFTPASSWMSLVSL